MNRRSSSEAFAGGPALRRPAGRHQGIEAVEPQLGDTVVFLGGAATRPEPLVERRRGRVRLHVAPDGERRGRLAHERAVTIAPVLLKVLAGEMRQALHAEHELHHDRTVKRQVSPCRTIRPAVGSWKCVSSTVTGRSA